MNITRRELVQGAALIGAAGIGLKNQLIAEDDTKQSAASHPILLQIYFEVAPERSAEFEKMYAESYVPAMRKQQRNRSRQPPGRRRPCESCSRRKARWV